MPANAGIQYPLGWRLMHYPKRRRREYWIVRLRGR